ncbi:MAG: tetratricopeptide repeat protein [Candidatus Aegiribacteria sp.]|nr:tetratricopeptide repeat protein [Candidatus Aegiribacteria sp.]
MEKKRESGEVLEHMLLEEVKLEQIAFVDPPDEWDLEFHQKEPYVPPILIEERDFERTDEESASVRYTLLAHHRSFWRMLAKRPLSIRALIVRSNVHIPLAHESIVNCTEEALLFDGLLRNGLCENRSRLSELLGYSRARITQILNLLKLPSGMRKKLLLTDEISEFQLRPLVRIIDPKKQTMMFSHLIGSKLTGRQMALFIDRKKEEKKDTGPDIEELMSEDHSPKESAVNEQADKPESDSQDKDHPGIQTVYVRELIRKVSSMKISEWETSAREAGASDTDIMLLQGVFMLRSGLYDRAIELLEIIIENKPDYAPAFFYLGRCGNLTGDLASAENYLRTALELVPDDPDYLIEFAIVLEKLKRNTEASTFYKRSGLLRKRFSED